MSIAKSRRGAPGAIRRANNAKSKIRSKAEHVFAEQKAGWICSFAPSAARERP